VVRTRDGIREYLLVESRAHPGTWVLPKGHIEPGETPEMTAVREVEEEAGVRAAVIAPAGESAYAVGGRRVRVVFFLMRYEGDVSPHEDRLSVWRGCEEARRMLSFDDARGVLTQAHSLEMP
jgi:8-oxo-dGTP pyrophosphatase MutT (NUDIX family)